MDDQRFDALATRLGGSRRRLLRNVVGLTGAAVLARFGANDVEAARRGFSGPNWNGVLNRDYYTLCTELTPTCCIQCYIAPSDLDGVRRRFLDCTANQRACADCARAATPSVGGACWVS